MDRFAHIFCAAALAAVPGACSAVTTQITIGEKYLASELQWTVSGNYSTRRLLLQGLKAKDSVTTQIVIGEKHLSGPTAARRKFLRPPVNTPTVIPLNGLKENGLNWSFLCRSSLPPCLRTDRSEPAMPVPEETTSYAYSRRCDRTSVQCCRLTGNRSRVNK